MKKILFGLLALILVFGCTAPSVPGLNDAATIDEFKSIRAEYGMEDGFNGTSSEMNAYLNKLSAFRGAIGFGEAGKVVGAEIKSATSFYYLIKALTESNSLNFYDLDCKDRKIENTLAYADAVISNANEAELLINALSPGARENLREYQLEAVQGYKVNAEQLKSSINEIC